MEVERGLGFDPSDRELEKLGYGVESHIPNIGWLRFIGVKCRIAGADVLTVTRNEILYSLNKSEDFTLAMVELYPGRAHKVHYLCQAFRREPDFGVTRLTTTSPTYWDGRGAGLRLGWQRSIGKIHLTSPACLGMFIPYNYRLMVELFMLKFLPSRSIPSSHRQK